MLHVIINLLIINYYKLYGLTFHKVKFGGSRAAHLSSETAKMKLQEAGI